MQKHAKKNYPFHFIGISIDEYNISTTEKLYIIPSVIILSSIDELFVIPSVIFLCPSVFAIVKLTYNRQIDRL